MKRAKRALDGLDGDIRDHIARETRDNIDRGMAPEEAHRRAMLKLVVVPNITPDTPALRENPVFMSFQDSFQRPNPFRPDVAIAIDDVIEKKIDRLDAHVSQMYEWLPWVAGSLDAVPKGATERRQWLKETRAGQPTPAVRTILTKWYGSDKGNAVRHAEAFEICEYGARPDEALLRTLFPFLPK